jgi:hypothetical protein
MSSNNMAENGPDKIIAKRGTMFRTIIICLALLTAFASCGGVKNLNLKPGAELLPAGNFQDACITNYGAYNFITQTVKDDLAGNWALLEVLPAKTHFENKGGVCKIFLDSPGNIDWQAQLTYFPCRLISGNTYMVSFDVKADSPRKLGFKVSRIGNDWLAYSGLKSFEVTADWKTISFVFKSPETDCYSRLEFECGSDRPSLYFRNISLKAMEEQ